MANTHTSDDLDPDGGRSTPADALLHIPGVGAGRDRHRKGRHHGRPRRLRITTVGGDDVVPAGRAIAIVVLTLVLGALLGADGVHRAAERQPFGPVRDVTLALAGPLRTVSHGVGLHLPRLWLAEATGNLDGPASSGAGAPLEGVPSAVEVGAGSGSSTSTPKPGALAPPRVGEGAAPVPGLRSPLPALPAPPPTPPATNPPPPALAVRRVATAEAPVRVWMGGDSLLGTLTAGVGRLVDEDPRVALDSDVRIGTGLARPDVLDWPAHLAEELAARRPEVVYLLFGGNDDQDMTAPDASRAVLGTPAWRAEYARRVALTMDVAAADGRAVVWIGLPTPEPERLRAATLVMAEVAREQAAVRPAVTYVDTGAVLTPDGVYRDAVVGADGSSVDARERDGVHITHAGADLVAPLLLAPTATQFGLARPG